MNWRLEALLYSIILIDRLYCMSKKSRPISYSNMNWVKTSWTDSTDKDYNKSLINDGQVKSIIPEQICFHFPGNKLSFPS